MPSTIDLRHINEREEDQRDRSRPVRGVVSSVQTETETVKIDVFQEPGRATAAIRHPYMGVNSWIRTMPEPGTSVVTQWLKEPQQIEIWGYISRRLGELVQKAQTDDKVIFRRLRPGEVEVMSSGRAYTHWSEDGNLTQMGGVVEHHLSQTELEATTRAPTHRRQLDQHDPTELAYEERFGLVKRPDLLKPAALQRYMKDELLQYQYEYGRWLRDDAGQDLTSLHEGHLFDDNGLQVKNTQTNRRVRLRRVVAGRQLGSLTLDVDEDLNVLFSNSTTAQTTNLDFGLQNTVKVSSRKLDFDVLQSSNQNYTQSLTVRAGQIRFNSTSTGFGFAPAQPAVLGPPLTGAVLTPLIAAVESAFLVLSTDNALADKPTKETLKGLAKTLNGLTAALPSTLSSEVLLTR